MTNIFPKRHEESIVLSNSLPPSLAFLVLFTQKVSPNGLSDLIHSEGVPRDNSNFIQHKETEKHSAHANSNKTLTIRWMYVGDAGDVNEKRSLAGLGCCSSVNVITLNDRGAVSSFIQPTPAEHLLWVGKYARRYTAEGEERRKLLVLIELTFSWAI